MGWGQGSSSPQRGTAPAQGGPAPCRLRRPAAPLSLKTRAITVIDVPTSGFHSLSSTPSTSMRPPSESFSSAAPQGEVVTSTESTVAFTATHRPSCVESGGRVVSIGGAGTTVGAGVTAVSPGASSIVSTCTRGPPTVCTCGSGAVFVTTPVTFDDVFFGSPGNPNPTGQDSIGTGNDTGVFYQIHKGRGDDIRSRFENIYDVALGKPGVLTNSGGLSFQGTLLDDTQLEVILRAVQKSDRSTVVTAPRLTAYNGQRANVTVLTQTSYISDFDVEIAQASQIGDPIVQTLRDGVILDLRPVVSADRRFITMELRPTIAVLTRPIATFATTLANGPPVTIQLPELSVSRVRTTVTVPDNGTLLLGGLKYFQETRLDSTVPFLDKIPVASFFFSRKGTYLEKRNLLVLIRAKILRPEENEPGLGRKF